MNFNNCFTHTYAGKPLPPKREYVAKVIVPCKTGAKAAQVTAFSKGSHITIGKQADSDKRGANLRARI